MNLDITLETAARLIRRLLNHADKIATTRPCESAGVNARADAGLWLARYDREAKQPAATPAAVAAPPAGERDAAPMSVSEPAPDSAQATTAPFETHDGIPFHIIDKAGIVRDWMRANDMKFLCGLETNLPISAPGGVGDPPPSHTGAESANLAGTSDGNGSGGGNSALELAIRSLARKRPMPHLPLEIAVILSADSVAEIADNLEYIAHRVRENGWSSGSGGGGYSLVVWEMFRKPNADVLAPAGEETPTTKTNE